MGKLFSNFNSCYTSNSALVLSQKIQTPPHQGSGELYPVVKIKFTKLQPRYIKQNRRSAYQFMYP